MRAHWSKARAPRHTGTSVAVDPDVDPNAPTHRTATGMLEPQPAPPARTPRGTEPLETESTSHLVSGLFHDLRELGTAHVQAMRGEVSNELSALSTSLKLFSVALSVMSVAVLMFLLGVARMLADVFDVDLWITYLGFGAALGVGGYLLLRAANPAQRVADGKADLVPETTLREAKDTASFVKEQLGRVVKDEHTPRR